MRWPQAPPDWAGAVDEQAIAWKRAEVQQDGAMMASLTCPNCGTTFYLRSVHPEQHGGVLGVYLGRELAEVAVPRSAKRIRIDGPGFTTWSWVGDVDHDDLERFWIQGCLHLNPRRMDAWLREDVGYTGPGGPGWPKYDPPQLMVEVIAPGHLRVSTGVTQPASTNE